VKKKKLFDVFGKEVKLPKCKVYLSRRNLEALISKLDRVAAGESSECAIIKRDNAHPEYAQSMKEIMVVAVENEKYYVDRPAGLMMPADVKTIS
jgi:hypothetical protein